MEKFIEYSDEKGTLLEAVSFIWDYVDQFKSPAIAIVARENYNDLSEMSDDEAEAVITFGVSVSGNVDTA